MKFKVGRQIDFSKSRRKISSQNLVTKSRRKIPSQNPVGEIRDFKIVTDVKYQSNFVDANFEEASRYAYARRANLWT